jgi:ankyrin repeat protein
MSGIGDAGYTCVHWAAACGHVDVLSLLLEAGAAQSSGGQLLLLLLSAGWGGEGEGRCPIQQWGHSGP